MKKWILLSLLVIVLVFLGITIYILSQPSGRVFTDEEREKKLEEFLGRDVKLNNQTPTGDAVYNGQAITFSYPAKAEVYEFRERSASSESNALDDFSFDLRNPRIIFNLKVTPTKLTSLDDVPAVRLRKSRSEYLQEKVALDGMRGIYFFKEKDAEISAFFINTGNLYIISMTGSSYDHLKELFDSILSSAKFR